MEQTSSSGDEIPDREPATEAPGRLLEGPARSAPTPYLTPAQLELLKHTAAFLQNLRKLLARMRLKQLQAQVHRRWIQIRDLCAELEPASPPEPVVEFRSEPEKPKRKTKKAKVYSEFLGSD